jgi:hypothetical protein
MRMNRDAPLISNEIVQRLIALKNANINIVLEIEAEFPEGVPEDIVRTITENCQTLKFKNQAFEE